MTLSAAVPERLVPDVRKSQEWYRDHLGFQIGWYNEGGDIGAVRRDELILFFRGGATELSRATLWVFAHRIDETYAELVAKGVEFVMPLQDTVYGLRQFSVIDPYGTTLHFHHDL